VIGVDLFERFGHRIRLSLSVGMGDIHDVDQEIGFGNFLEGGLKSSHQLGGELLDESNRIGDQGIITPGSSTRRVVGSRVAKSLSAT